MSTVAQRVAELRKKTAEKRAAEGRVSIADQNGGAVRPTAGSAPMPTPTEKVELTTQAPAGALPEGVFSTEDPRNPAFKPPVDYGGAPVGGAQTRMQELEKKLADSEAERARIEQATMQSRESAEDQRRIREEELFQEKQKRIQGRTEVSPRLGDLSEQERRLLNFDVTGEGLQERGQPRIREAVPVSTGREAIREVDRARQDKLNLMKANFEQAQREKAMRAGLKPRPFSPGASKFAEQMAKQREALKQAEELAKTEKEEVGAIKSDINTLKTVLGVETTQDINILEDGRIQIVDKDTREVFDPVKRAQERFERDTYKQVQDAHEAHNAKTRQIRAQYSTEDGELTMQGKKLLARTESDFAIDIRDYQEKRQEQFEGVLLQEKQRQMKLEEFASPATPKKLTSEDVLKKRMQEDRISMINDIIDESRDENGIPAINHLQASKLLDKRLNKLGSEEKVDQYQAFRAQVKGVPVDQWFDLAVGATNNNIEDAVKALQTAGVPEALIEQDLQDYQINRLGISPEFVGEMSKVQKTKKGLEDVLSGNGDSLGLSMAGIAADLKSQDPSGLMQKAFLRQVQNSPSTSLIEKAIAESMLKTKAGEKTLKERFLEGELSTEEEEAFLERTSTLKGAEKGIAESIRSLGAESIDTATKEFIDGNLSADELKKFFGEEGAKKIGERVIQLRTLERKKGKVLSSDEERKVNQQIIATDSYKALNRAEPSLNALLEFEKAFEKTGKEMFTTGKISPQYRSALLQAKEFFNLGVLNGPDLEILEDVLPNPTGFLSFMTYDASVKNGIQNLKTMIQDHTSANLEDLLINYDELGDLRGLRTAQNKADRVLEGTTGLRKEFRGIPGFTREDQGTFDKMNEQQQSEFLDVLGVKKKDSTVSQATATRPIRNLNPINIKKGGVADQYADKNTDGTTKTDDQGHLIFPSAEAGIKGGKADLRAKVSGGSRHLSNNPTIAQLGKVFAEDPNWPRSVASILGVDVNTPTQDIDFDELFRAVSMQEGGSGLLTKNSQ